MSLHHRETEAQRWWFFESVFSGHPCPFRALNSRLEHPCYFPVLFRVFGHNLSHLPTTSDELFFLKGKADKNQHVVRKKKLKKQENDRTEIKAFSFQKKEQPRGRRVSEWNEDLRPFGAWRSGVFYGTGVLRATASGRNGGERKGLRGTNQPESDLLRSSKWTAVFLFKRGGKNQGSEGRAARWGLCAAQKKWRFTQPWRPKLRA